MRVCTWPGCHALVQKGRCEKHKKQERKEYDAGRIDDPFHKFYATAQWRRVRLLVLERDCYLCQECKRKGVLTGLTSSDHVHHKHEIRDGGDPLDMDNLEALCHSCHSKHSVESGVRFGNR